MDDPCWRQVGASGQLRPSRSPWTPAVAHQGSAVIRDGAGRGEQPVDDDVVLADRCPGAPTCTAAISTSRSLSAVDGSMSIDRRRSPISPARCGPAPRSRLDQPAGTERCWCDPVWTARCRPSPESPCRSPAGGHVDEASGRGGPGRPCSSMVSTSAVRGAVPRHGVVDQAAGCAQSPGVRRVDTWPGADVELSCGPGERPRRRCAAPAPAVVLGHPGARRSGRGHHRSVGPSLFHR